MGMMGFINLAHGVFAMAGGYVMTGLINDHGAPFAVAAAAAAVAVALASIPLERVADRRLYGGDESRPGAADDGARLYVGGRGALSARAGAAAAAPAA